MATLDSHAQTVEKEGKREPFHISPETAKRMAESERRRKRWQRIKEWEASNPLYWIVDQTPDDHPRIFGDSATTSAQRRRARVRSWFSWPNLGRLAEKEVFGVGLGAVMLVPAAGGLLDIVEPLLTKLVPDFSGLSLPMQAKALFFSGLCFVIGNALYFFRCPAIVKIATSNSNSPQPPMFNKIVVNDAAFLLSHGVDAAFITTETLRMPDKVIRLKEHERSLCEHLLKSGIALPRVGFVGDGMYLAEKFLLTSAESRGGRLFVKTELKDSWEPVHEVGFMLTNDFSLYHGILHHPSHTMKEVEGASEKDMFLEWYLADAGAILDVEKGGRRLRYIEQALHGFDHRYFDGCDFGKMANLLAEWQYYLRPGSRVLVALSFMGALGLLAWFLVLQTINVI